MKIIHLNNQTQSDVIKEAVTCLNQGGLVIYPTETLYGAGVDATNQQAVNKLLAYKSRREGKPLSIAVADQTMAEQYVKLTPQAENLYEKFLPGPYTIVSESKQTVADEVASEFNTLGIRIPDHQLILDLTKQLGKPLTSTSANVSGKKRPYQVKDIFEHTSKKQQELIDLVIDAGKLAKNPPSTVIDTTLSTPLTMRSSSNNRQEQQTLISRNETETKQIAGKLLLKKWNQLKETGLLIGLNGKLGAGKTIFAKGLGQFLQIDQSITSPTYTYIKEYSYQRHQTSGIFYHIDTWKIDSKDQLETLEIDKLFSKNNVIAIEWWSQVKDYFADLSQPRIIVDFEVLTNNKRQLKVYEP
jgi:L-threonylcarbamoyladenylate synthase